MPLQMNLVTESSRFYEEELAANQNKEIQCSDPDLCREDACRCSGIGSEWELNKWREVGRD
jgi:hypothetical protein